jgi:hypothetical protein
MNKINTTNIEGFISLYINIPLLEKVLKVLEDFVIKTEIAFSPLNYSIFLCKILYINKRSASLYIINTIMQLRDPTDENPFYLFILSSENDLTRFSVIL